MAKALIALCVLVGVLVIPSGAAAAETQEFLFQGGGDPFGGEHPVGMTMIGHDVNKPSRVTGFSMADVEWNCTPFEGFNDVSSHGLAKFPLWENSKSTKTISDKNGLYFEWSWTRNGPNGPGSPYSLQFGKLIGGQHHKDSERWVGKARLHPYGVAYNDAGKLVNWSCEIKGADANGFVKWQAQLVKACPKQCKELPLSSVNGEQIALPPSTLTSSTRRSDFAASDSKKKKCKGRKKQHGKKKKCHPKKPKHPTPSPAPPAPPTGPAWSSGRYTGHYVENAAIELRFNVVGSRLYTGAFDDFFVSAQCAGTYFDPLPVSPVEASIGANGDFVGSGVYTPGFGLERSWHLSGHIAGKSITNGAFTVDPYTNTFGEQCSGTSHFTGEWFADYTL